MSVKVKLHTQKKGEINRFLSKFYNTNLSIYENLEWEKEYKNPIEISDIIGTYVDNYNDFININMWICLDKNIFINITDLNANKIIKYLFERYPY